jgi:hypothetical protein
MTVEQRLQVEVDKVDDKIQKLQTQERELIRERERLTQALNALSGGSEK